MNSLYSFTMDLFPLIDDLEQYSPMLAYRICDNALAILTEDKPTKNISELKLLLRLSGDLGYLDMDIVSFLLKALDRCA